jgi:hypothetical protein
MPMVQVPGEGEGRYAGGARHCAEGGTASGTPPPQPGARSSSGGWTSRATRQRVSGPHTHKVFVGRTCGSSRPPARPPARTHARIPVSTAGARGQGCAPPSEEFIATVCKNAAHLRLKRFKSVGQEFDENWAQQLVPLLDGSCSFDGSVDKNVIWFVPGASLPPPGAAP